MNSAKISSNGRLQFQSKYVIYKAQTAFEGVAESMNVYNDDDVQDLVNEVRYGKNNN